MTDSDVDPRLARLLQRLVAAAETALAAGDLESARATAEEILAVDPGNAAAARLAHQAAEQRSAPTGERALMTLIFADLVGSTRIAEQVEPEQLRDLFSFYRAAARTAVERYDGYVVKYMGDGILAGFGYPDAHEDDARRAVQAGLDLVTALQEARDDLQQRLGVAAQVRVGVHTGRVVIADLSDPRSSDERDSIVGVTPNLAARIQSVGSADQVVISDVTRHLIETDFHLQTLGTRRLKGISRAVEVFAVQRPRHAGARFHADRYRRVGLIDRQQHLQRLVGAWDRLDRPEPPPGDAFLIVGEAGIGKTRLAAELVDHVEARDGRVLGAACLPYYATVALWPLAHMLQRIISATGATEDLEGRLAEHLESVGMDPRASLPFLAPLVGVAPSASFPAPELDPAAALAETLTQTVEWLAALGSRRAVLLVVEDLHWADPSTLALLGRIVRRRPDGVLTVATTRPEPDVAWSGEAEIVTLSRLGVAAAGRLVDELAAGRQLPADVRESIVSRSEGIPLFVEELTQSRMDEGSGEGMPLRLRELLTWRLKSPRVDLHVAQTAATLGPAFDALMLGEVLGDPELVAQQLPVLVDEGIIEPAQGPGTTHRFRHALMRDAAYETQTLDGRAAAHGHIAESLAHTGAEPVLVAQHLERSGDAAGAAAMYVAAAQAQQVKGAHAEAAELLTRAVDQLAVAPESPDRDLAELTAHMLRGLSVSALQGYAAPGVQDDHRRADDLAKRLAGRPELLPSLIAIWAYWFTSGELQTSGGLIERLQDMVADEAFAWFQPEVESCAGFQNLFTGELGPAHEHFERAMAGFRTRPQDESVSPFWPLPNDPIAVSAIGLACICMLRGDTAGAAMWEAEAVLRAQAIGFPRGPWSAAFVKVYGAWMRRIGGDDAGSRALGQEVVQIGQTHGYTYWVMLGSSYLAGVGDDSPDGDFHEDTLATVRAMGQHAFAAAGLAQLAALRAAEGDPARAHELIEEALKSVHKSGEFLHLAELLRLRAHYRLASGGSAAQAAEDLLEAVDIAGQQGAAVARLAAAVALARLPEPDRPDRWRPILQQARAGVPGELVSAETVAADEMLT